MKIDIKKFWVYARGILDLTFFVLGIVFFFKLLVSDFILVLLVIGIVAIITFLAIKMIPDGKGGYRPIARKNHEEMVKFTNNFNNWVKEQKKNDKEFNNLQERLEKAMEDLNKDELKNKYPIPPSLTEKETEDILNKNNSCNKGFDIEKAMEEDKELLEDLAKMENLEDKLRKNKGDVKSLTKEEKELLDELEGDKDE